jgi:glycosyltransferase involved in cell wall biosynthesis
MEYSIPEISVIIPLYNNGQFVKQAVDSVLEQKNVTLECIIVDDGSTDKGVEILDDIVNHNLKIFRQSHTGVSASRNFGAKEAKGVYLAFLDADDFWAPTKLSKQVLFLKKNPDYSAVYCQGFLTDESGKMAMRKPSGTGIHDDYFELINSLERTISPALGSTLMIKKEDFFRLKGFDTKLSNGEDRDFRLRMSQNGYKQHMLNETLSFIRIRKNSVSHSLDEDQWEKVFRSNLRLYSKLLSTLPEGREKQLVRRNLNRVYIRQRIYFQIIGRSLESEAIIKKINSKTDFPQSKPLDFFKQIDFFTPLVFQRGERLAVINLINSVFDDIRNFFPDQKDQIFEEIVKIKGEVWCARRGNFDEKVSTLFKVFTVCKSNLGLLLRVDFWKEIGKLIIGNPLLWLYSKWKTINSVLN